MAEMLKILQRTQDCTLPCKELSDPKYQWCLKLRNPGIEKGKKWRNTKLLTLNLFLTHYMFDLLQCVVILTTKNYPVKVKI